MLKILLMLAIAAACTGIGRTLAVTRRRRGRALGEIVSALRVLRLRLLNSMEPLGILLRKSEATLLCAIGETMREGETLEACWRDLRADPAKRCVIDGFSREDLRLLDTFFHGLGVSGRDEQNALFAEAIDQLEEARQQAQRAYADAARLYTALGALAGIAILIWVA